jgi:phosphopantothenoylcysteine synthetase/decarboxylase
MRAFLFAALLAVAALPAKADITEAFARHLYGQGYESVTVQRTWLGRMRFVARRGDTVREVILNPNTGEILRDYAQGGDGSVLLPQAERDGALGDRARRGEDDEYDEDAEDDDEDDMDEEDGEDEDDDDDDEDDDDDDDGDDEEDEDEDEEDDEE